MPENTVKVDRTSRLFGNPFRPIDPTDREHALKAVAYYRRYVAGEERFLCGPSEGVTLAVIPHWTHAGEVRSAVERLRGWNLACWCKPGSPCHADVLLELANAPSSSSEKLG
jgi:hypothetical protein